MPWNFPLDLQAIVTEEDGMESIAHRFLSAAVKVEFHPPDSIFDEMFLAWNYYYIYYGFWTFVFTTCSIILFFFGEYVV